MSKYFYQAVLAKLPEQTFICCAAQVVRGPDGRLALKAGADWHHLYHALEDFMAQSMAHTAANDLASYLSYVLASALGIYPSSGMRRQRATNAVRVDWLNKCIDLGHLAPFPTDKQFLQAWEAAK